MDTDFSEPQHFGSMEEHTCRICRGEATEEEPLYHPCQCKGSIRYVHEKCLLEWIEAKKRSHTDVEGDADGDDQNNNNNPIRNFSKELHVECDICHHPYKFKTIYDENTPDKLDFFTVVTNFMKFLSEKLVKSLLMVLFLLMIMIMPFVWGFHARTMTFLLDRKLPYEGQFRKSVVYGYSQFESNVLWQLVQYNHLFFALQIVFVVIVNLAVYFLYDMVAREKVFLQMLQFRRGPQFSMKELLIKQFQRTLPGLDSDSLEKLADMYMHNHENQENQQEQRQEQPVRRRELNAPEQEHHEQDNDDHNEQHHEDNEEHQEHDAHDAEGEVEDSDDEEEEEAQEPHGLFAENAPEPDRNAVRAFDNLIDMRQQQGQQQPIAVPAQQAAQPEQGPFILNLTLSWSTLVKSFGLAFVAFFIYEFIAYYIPTFIGYGLIKIYAFFTRIAYKTVVRLLNLTNFNVAVKKVFAYDFIITPIILNIYQTMLSTVTMHYSNYSTNAFPDSVWYRATPAGTTFVTFILLTCAASEYMHRGYGPKNGMTNSTQRMIFYVLFSIEYTSKVFLIFVSELAGFPVLAGIMIDWSLVAPCLLPHSEKFLIPKLTKFLSAPVSFIVYWCMGTLYMYWFSRYIGMIRQYILRSGVLFFIRSPDDPNTRILHDSLIHPLSVQVSRLCLSMFIYSIIIVCGFGFFTRLAFPTILPNVLPLQPVLDYQHDSLFIYKALALLILFYLSKVVVEMHTPTLKVVIRHYWSKCFKMFCSKLRLSSFILGLDSVEERGYICYRNIWYKYVTPENAQHSNLHLFTEPKTLKMAKDLFRNDKNVHAYFIPNGSLMRVPGSDIISRNFIKTLFVPVTKEDKLVKKIDFEKAQQKQRKGAFDHLDVQSTEFDEYSVVYTPPNFVSRYYLLLVFVWLFSSFIFIGSAIVSNYISKFLFAALGFPVAYIFNRHTELFAPDYFKSVSSIHVSLGLMVLAALVQNFQIKSEKKAKIQELQQNQEGEQLDEPIVELAAGNPVDNGNFIGLRQIMDNLIKNAFFYHILNNVLETVLYASLFVLVSIPFGLVSDLTFFRFFGMATSVEDTVSKTIQTIESSWLSRVTYVMCAFIVGSIKSINGGAQNTRSWSYIGQNIMSKLKLAWSFFVVPAASIAIIWAMSVGIEKFFNTAFSTCTLLQLFKIYYLGLQPQEYIWNGVLHKVFCCTPLLVVLGLYVPLAVSWYKHVRQIADEIVKRKVYARGRTLENLNTDED